MYATRTVLVLLLAFAAVAIAIPAALPQSPPVAPAAIEQRQSLENIADGIEQSQDLKGSSSYGYGFYGPYHGYPHYYRYGYPYHYGYYPYRSYWGYYRPYYGYWW